MMRRITVAAVPAILFLFNASFNQAHADEALEENRAKWQAAGISSYEYRYRKVCECHPETPADTIVTVAGGDIVAVSYDREDYLEPIPVPAEKHDWFRTVEDLFVLVERALDSAEVIRVSYDPELGYPTRIFVDYEVNLVDEEVELQVVSLSEQS